MPCRCSAIWCFRTNAQNVSLHRFPQNEQLLQAWLDFVGITDSKERLLTDGQLSKMALCSAHFEPECFSDTVKLSLGFVNPKRGRTLNRDAIPTVKAPWSGAQILGTRSTNQVSDVESRSKLAKRQRLMESRGFAVRDTADEYLGMFCRKAEVQTSDLLDGIPPRISRDKLTVGLILDLSNFASEMEFSSETVFGWVKSLVPVIRWKEEKLFYYLLEMLEDANHRKLSSASKNWPDWLHEGVLGILEGQLKFLDTNFVKKYHHVIGQCKSSTSWISASQRPLAQKMRHSKLSCGVGAAKPFQFVQYMHADDLQFVKAEPCDELPDFHVEATSPNAGPATGISLEDSDKCKDDAGIKPVLPPVLNDIKLESKHREKAKDRSVHRCHWAQCRASFGQAAALLRHVTNHVLSDEQRLTAHDHYPTASSSVGTTCRVCSGLAGGNCRCEECGVGLCWHPCFKLWHTELDYEAAYLVASKKSVYSDE